MSNVRLENKLVAIAPTSYMLTGNMEAGVSPFDEGVMAAETGMSKDDNPYKPGTSAYSDWNAGYEFATDADEATELDNE